MNDTHQNNQPDTFAEPPRLRLLRWLVTGLAATLIVGFLIIVGLLVTFVTQRKPPTLANIPNVVELPAGETAIAFTRGTGWYAVVTRDGDDLESIRIFDLDGKLLQSVPVRANVNSK